MRIGSHKATALALLAGIGTSKERGEREDFLNQALELATDIDEPEVRARTLLTIAARAFPERRINVEAPLQIIRNALIEKGESRPYYDALGDITHLGRGDEALSMVAATGHPYERMKALAFLSGQLPDSLLSRVLSEVWRSPNQEPVERVLKTIVPRLDDSALHAELGRAVVADAPIYIGRIIGTFAAEMARRGEGYRAWMAGRLSILGMASL
jgi:hypothetical protein